MIWARRLSLCFSAGVVGALVGSAGLWAAGRYGVSSALGVGIAPVWVSGWLYPRLVLGGLWGLLFAVPLRANMFWLGVLLSLIPTAYILLWEYPYRAGYGWFGVELGLLTPLLIWAASLIWAWSGLLWLQLTGR